MNIEQHLQQLIGTLAIQLCQKDELIDKLREEVQALTKNQRKLKKVRDDNDKALADSK